ncbi:MAG: GNAT family N-acetyltransferase [Bacteroidetes bacterium]|nr:GNAT family N-acetyltransferase [Bacteroidota bacterium]
MRLFETGRLTVQRFTEADADVFYQVNGDEEMMRFIRPAKKRSESDAFLTENIKLYQNGSIVGRFAVFTRAENRFVGTFSFLYLSDAENIHLGYALLKQARGRGYATELVKAGLHHFFQNTARNSIFAITDPANTASREVLLRAGLSFRGQWQEHGSLLELYGIDREGVGLQGSLGRI